MHLVTCHNAISKTSRNKINTNYQHEYNKSGIYKALLSNSLNGCAFRIHSIQTVPLDKLTYNIHNTFFGTFKNQRHPKGKKLTEFQILTVASLRWPPSIKG